MFYLVFAILASTSIIICFKLFERFGISIVQAITMNYLTASFFGFMYEGYDFAFTDLPAKPWFHMAIIVGFTLIAGFNLFGLSTQKAGVVVTAISAKMSVVIPVSLGFLIFSEIATPLKIAGILLALFSFYLTFLKGKGIAIDLRYIFLPLIMFVVMGSNESLMKYAQFHFIGEEFVLFLSTAFLVSLFLGLIILLFRVKNEKFALKNILAGIILGLFNWFSTYYMLKGMSLFDVSVVVPIINVSVVAASTLIGFLFFHEQLRPINWAGIFLAMVAIIFMAVAI